jgi:viroplasmin and RNaseH domain-containing protein
MRYKSVISSFLFVLALSGCGYQEGVVTPEKKSYLYFTGDVNDVKVVVDNNEGFTVEEGSKHKYKINPGKHKVTVYRGDKIIVNREIFVSDGVEKEIEVQP